MPSLTNAVAGHFFDLRNWAHTVWLTQSTLGVDRHTSAAGKAGHADFLNTLSTIVLEYAVLQITKLHDSPHYMTRDNLTISYVLENGGWDDKTAARLQGLADHLTVFIIGSFPPETASSRTTIL